MLMSSVPVLAFTVFHLTVNIQYEYFPKYYSNTCLWRKPHIAKDNRERSKDQTAQSITNRTQSIMRQYVSAISVPEWDSWAD